MKSNLVADIEEVFAEGGVSATHDQNMLLRFDVLVQNAAQFSVLAIPVKCDTGLYNLAKEVTKLLSKTQRLVFIIENKLSTTRYGRLKYCKNVKPPPHHWEH